MKVLLVEVVMFSQRKQSVYGNTLVPLTLFDIRISAQYLNMTKRSLNYPTILI